MKITFMEEIEARRAWRECMACPRCDELKFNIHHQTSPQTYNDWWVSCPNCDFTADAAPTRKLALQNWKNTGRWK